MGGALSWYTLRSLYIVLILVVKTKKTWKKLQKMFSLAFIWGLSLNDIYFLTAFGHYALDLAPKTNFPCKKAYSVKGWCSELVHTEKFVHCTNFSGKNTKKH